MATTQCEKTLTMIRGETFADSLGEIVKLNTSGQVVKAGGLAAQASDIVIGVVAEHVPAATAGVGQSVPAIGDAVPIHTIEGGGILKMKAGAAITVGQIVIPHAAATTATGRITGVDGKANLAVNQAGLGIALDAATAGELIRVYLQTIVKTA